MWKTREAHRPAQPYRVDMWHKVSTAAVSSMQYIKVNTVNSRLKSTVTSVAVWHGAERNGDKLARDMSTQTRF